MGGPGRARCSVSRCASSGDATSCCAAFKKGGLAWSCALRSPITLAKPCGSRGGSALRGSPQLSDAGDPPNLEHELAQRGAPPAERLEQARDRAGGRGGETGAGASIQPEGGLV